MKNMSKKLQLITYLIFFLSFTQAQSFNYPELISRISTDNRSGIKDVGMMDSWVSAQNTDGSWSTFRYGKLTAANTMNTTDNHVLRLWHLAAAVTKLDHVKYNNENYKNAVKKGLAYWYASNTTDPNWWYNWIYNPQRLGETLIFMREFDGFIPTSSSTEIDESKIISLFQPKNINDITAYGTGANAIDIGLHFVYRGILQENGSLLEQTRNKLESTLSENIKDDLVFHDHGPQIQISSYGWVFADGIVRLASYLADSPAAFDINSESFGKVVGFIKNTQISSIRGSSWDFSIMGRAVSRVNALNASMNYLQKMADFIDPENAIIYLNALDRIRGNKTANYNITEHNKHYWVSDYSQHVRNGYLFTVRNVSTRTVEAENGNGENLKANYFSYGANFISIDGNEYKNIMPYWDWSMIPGTTFPYTTTYPKRADWGVNFGTTTFVGGLSDGRYGLSVLDMNKSGTQAKKSWFFFDDEIVCLGAGISDNSNRNVRTTVNQTKMETPSYIRVISNSNEQQQSTSSSIYETNDLIYIRQAKTAYFFPEQGNVKYTMKSQSGTWKSINVDGSDKTESGYVFSLWFDHGINPNNKSYSYIVVPGVDTKAKAEAYDLSNIEIVSNNSSIQVVANKKLNILQAIFYQPGTFTYNDYVITVNQACALMIKDGSIVTVSDPTQSLNSIDVSISVNENKYSKNIIFPSQAGKKGASVTVDFEIETSNISTITGNLFQIDSFSNMVSNGIFNIQTFIDDDLSCTVHNANGNVVLKKKLSRHDTINLRNNSPGVYLISVNHKNKLYTQKIIR